MRLSLWVCYRLVVLLLDVVVASGSWLVLSCNVC